MRSGIGHTYRFIYFFPVLFFISSVSMDAQSVLTLKRMIYDYPDVTLYFTVHCGGVLSFPTSTSVYEIKDNNVDVSLSSYWSPGNASYWPVSAALVFDASWSMSGSANAGAKAAGNTLIDSMVANRDIAAVIWGSDSVNIQQGFSSDHALLHKAVNALPASGSPVVWDAVYAGIQELIRSANTHSRAVIVLSGGSDSGSVHSVEEIIQLAVNHNIHICTIGLGVVTPYELESMAVRTGGYYYHASDTSSLVDIYETVLSLAQSGFTECMLRYSIPCADGIDHTIQMRTDGYCGNESNVLQTVYKAALDASTFIELDVALGEMVSMNGGSVYVPLTIETDLSSAISCKDSRITITYDSTELQYISYLASPGTLLEGVAVTVLESAGQVVLQLSGQVIIDKQGVMAYLHFQPATNPPDVVISPVEFQAWDVKSGCIVPYLHDGSVTIYNAQVPAIHVYGDAVICDGDSLLLEVSGAFDEYDWSTGEHTQSIWVRDTGAYHVKTRIADGAWFSSNEVRVTKYPHPQPVIVSDGDTSFCHGHPVVLSIHGQWDAILWSTGDTTNSIMVCEEGDYSVQVQNEYGCWGESSTVHLSSMGPNPEISGPRLLCSNAPAIYSTLSQAGCSYTWTSGDAEILSGQGSAEISLQWIRHNGILQVEVFDSLTHCTVKDTFSLASIFVQPHIRPLPSRILCSQESKWLVLNGKYSDYLWSTGETTDSIRINKSGTYYCTVSIGKCSGWSDTIVVTHIDDVDIHIEGDVVVCPDAISEYRVLAYPDLKYRWTAIGGEVISEGPNPMVLWGETGQGYLLGTYSNGWCRDTIGIAVEIISTPHPMVHVQGDTIICEGDSVRLVADPNLFHYMWNNDIPMRHISVRQSGEYYYTALDSQGCRVTSNVVSVRVNKKPPVPMILTFNDTLVCDVPGVSYTWYIDGREIPGENEKMLIARLSGHYVVRISGIGGCSESSDSVLVTNIGGYCPGLAQRFSVTPNPNSGSFSVEIEMKMPEVFTLRIVNVAGQTLYSESVAHPVVQFNKSIRIDGIAPGICFVTIESKHGFDYRKVVVQAN